MTPAVAVVAGSGLDLTGVLDSVEREIPFADAGPLAPAAVRGHEGRFLIGRCGEARAIVQCGRLHFYEGLSYDAVTGTVDALRALGAAAVVFTNAAGGLDPGMRPGDLMAVDALRLWRFRGWPGAPESIAPDFEIGGCDWRGAYHWVHGPCYETRSEIQALRQLSSSAVGMSTAPEMHRARALGLPAAAVSCITNNCCMPQKLTHEHVLETAAAASERLCALLRRYIAGSATGVSRNRAPSSR